MSNASDPIEVLLESGEKQNVTVRTLRVADYAKALAAEETDNEAALVDIATGQLPGFALQLTPESYEILVAKLYELNPCFFARAARRSAKRGLRDYAVTVASGASRGSTTSRS